MPPAPTHPTFQLLPGLTPYAEALALQDQLVQQVLAGGPEVIVLCEHPPVITVGTGGGLTDAEVAGTPVQASGRGGKATLHNPGQRVVYPILDLNRRGRDLKMYVRQLEDWGIAALAELGMTALRTEDIGVWLPTAGGPPAKVLAIGVRVRRWVSLHGMALNVCNDLTPTQHFTPCGLTGKRMTRLVDHGWQGTLAEVDAALRHTCPF
jgi:lipoyl(octanoyl) transferase